MKKAIVIGRTGVGKTLFTINFASELGNRSLVIDFETPDGETYKRQYGIEEAIRELTGSDLHKTRSVQSVSVYLPAGKGKKPLNIIDTSGLIDGIHPDVRVRRAMAQTLSKVRFADIVLHVIDASSVSAENLPGDIGEVDYQVARFAQLKPGYAILANKMDLKGSEEGLAALRKEFPGLEIIPISALRRTGFKEVRSFVTRQL